MSCGCIYVGDYDPPCRYSERIMRSPKSQKCGECGLLISPLCKHEKVTGNWGRGLNTHRTCLDCISVRDEFFCDGFIIGSIWENIGEHVNDLEGQIESECLLSLTPKAREGVIDCIQSVFDDLDEEDDSEIKEE